MKTSQLSLAAALVALSLSSESHAGRPSRAPSKRAQTKAGRGTAGSAPVRFGGKRSLKKSARTLPAAVRNHKPVSAAAGPSAMPSTGSATGPTAAPSVGKSPLGATAVPVASNVLRVLAHKYDSGNPKFRVESVHGAQTVTPAGATFQGKDTSMMQFRYEGSPGDILSMQCTLSMAASATPIFEVHLGGAKGTVPLPAGKTVRTLKYKAPMKGSWQYVSIKSKTPEQAWTWHECTLTVD